MNSNVNDITLADILVFIGGCWKYLILAGIFGAVLGYGGWFFFASYKSEIILLNSTQSLNLLSWRSLQKGLPTLARQIITKGELPPDHNFIYSQMSEPGWWLSNSLPSYALSKSDAKELILNARDTRDFDSASTKILNFLIHTRGESKQSAINNVLIASEFLKKGSAYLELKKLVNDLTDESINVNAKIHNELIENQVNQVYIRMRIKDLETLQERFPQLSNGKYFNREALETGTRGSLIENQLLIANEELNKSKEIASKLNGHLERIGLIKQFLDQVNPMIANESDGIALTRSFLNITESLQKKISGDNLMDKLFFSQLRVRLLEIESQFSNGLTLSSAPITKKSGLLKAISGGLALAEFIMLAFLLTRKKFVELILKK